jgi:hypothetical protein
MCGSVGPERFRSFVRLFDYVVFHNLWIIFLTEQQMHLWEDRLDHKLCDSAIVMSIRQFKNLWNGIHNIILELAPELSNRAEEDRRWSEFYSWLHPNNNLQLQLK